MPEQVQAKTDGVIIPQNWSLNMEISNVVHIT